MYIKNRGVRNYDRLLKTDLCKLLGVQRTLEAKEGIITIFHCLRSEFLPFGVVQSVLTTGGQRDKYVGAFK